MALSNLHPASANWFESKFGQATAVQKKAWEAIQAGKNTLISAPTGSGKTLAAFYAAIDDLVQKGTKGQLLEGVQILYVSPLKALSNDIHKNLETPLDGIAEQLNLLGESPVNISIAVRTGDTPAKERQKMVRNPPHILVTTPESLYLLLTSTGGRSILSAVSTLIVDEIHAMLGDKRGSHLALSMERLQNLVNKNTGQYVQRIGLSATQKPIQVVMKYLVGCGGIAQRTEGEKETECEIIDSGFQRDIDVTLEVPESPLSALMSNEVWEELYRRLVELIHQHETTLVFVNTRRLSERLALALSERLGERFVCSHHGSMSKDLRYDAEQKLKAGELKVLVATASMELGIDIGSIDLVVQFSSPKSIATFLQRIGRSGHTIHGTPKGILFPLTRDDLVESTALLHSIKKGELDRVVVPQKPMDILAQQIVAEVSAKPSASSSYDDSWDLGELFALFKKAYSYGDLTSEEFNKVVQMLSDGYSTRRGRRGTHLHLDAINNKVRARRGANLISITNGGAIPDMFDYQVVLDPEDVVVGSLNEDFALEALPGDVFTLGTHAWQMLRIDGLKVRVRDAEGAQPTIPFWFGEGPSRTQELSVSVAEIKQTIADFLTDNCANAAIQFLVDEVSLPLSAAIQITEYLQSGINALGVMPTRELIVIERFFDEVGDMHVVIHSPYGSRINRGWGLALRKRFCKSFNFELQAAANEDSIVISLGSIHSFPLDDVFKYLRSENVREVLIQAMLDAPMFEVRWRWNATRSLAIQRNRNGKRVPPQFQRMDAEDLTAHIFPDQIACQENIVGTRDIPDHPLVKQTVNDCLTEAMDIKALEKLIGNIEQKSLTLVSKDLREPSPFAQEIINARPYAFLDDAPFEERRTNAIRNRRWLDPSEEKDYSLLDSEAILQVRQEAWPYVSNAEELHDALLSLSYMTDAEFTLHQCGRWKEQLIREGRLLQLKSHINQLWIAAEYFPKFKVIFSSMKDQIALPESLLAQDWSEEKALIAIIRGRLEGSGPILASSIADQLKVDIKKIDATLIALETEGFAFQGHFSNREGKISKTETESTKQKEWCERRLLQRIHRYTIDAHRKATKPVSIETYNEFLFEQHQLVPINKNTSGQEPSLDGPTKLQNTLNLLDGIACPAATWEADIYPARIENYDPSWLDTMCISGKVAWGRYSLPNSFRRPGKTRAMGPVKSTPITLAGRKNLDIWQALARSQLSKESVKFSGIASKIEADLEAHGASFFGQIQSRTGLLKSQLEEGLGELVGFGRVCSDSYTGLRALLTPANKKPSTRRRRNRRTMFGVEDAGRWSLLDTFQLQLSQEGANKKPSHTWQILDEEQIERLISIYLQRWGVLMRSLLERESFAPPWRVLLMHLRKLESRGVLRGGRFVAGVGGEQFAFPETVDALRKLHKKKKKNQLHKPFYSLSASDPLNLLSLSLPGKKIARFLRNRVLYQGGSPIAILENGEVHFLRNVESQKQWDLSQILRKRNFPERLRSYLGVHN